MSTSRSHYKFKLIRADMLELLAIPRGFSLSSLLVCSRFLHGLRTDLIPLTPNFVQCQGVARAVETEIPFVKHLAQQGFRRLCGWKRCGFCAFAVSRGSSRD